MPYLKQPSAPCDKLRRLLKGYEITGETLGEMIGCSTVTGCRRLKNPGSLTVAELLAISQRGHIPIDEIREAIG